ncbi:MAG: DUF488 domain-containing protein [Planctomycetaceae bacterium]
MKKSSLYTIGYSGHSPETFLKRLKDAGVEVLIDVREKPLSRKKGFSKTSLNVFLNDNGIEYLHIRELGVPGELRDELKKGWCLHEYFSAFRYHLNGCTGILEQVYAMAQRSACCLMCVEHVVEECHRSVVAETLFAQNGRKLKVEHL